MLCNTSVNSPWWLLCSVYRPRASPFSQVFNSSLLLHSINCIHAYSIATSIIHAKLDYCNTHFLDTDITEIDRLHASHNALARAVTKTPQTPPHHSCSENTPLAQNTKNTSLAQNTQMNRIQSNITPPQHTSILQALLPPSAVHDPTTSFNPFL